MTDTPTTPPPDGPPADMLLTPHLGSVGGQQPPRGHRRAEIDPADVIPTNVLEAGDRLTGKAMLYHEQFGEQPEVTDLNFSAMLDTKHQVYRRRVSVTNEWTPLDIGWIPEGDVGYIVLENRTGAARQVNPTQEELDADKEQVAFVRLGDSGPGWPVRPMRFFVAEAGSDTIYVRADGEKPTRMNIVIYPR